MWMLTAYRRCCRIPEVPSDVKPTIYFVQLNLKDATGRLLSSNSYWLSTKKPEFDWEKTSLVYTPVTSYEDMTRLIEFAEDASQGDSTSSVRRRTPTASSHPEEHIGGAGIPGATCGGSGESRAKRCCRYSGKIITSRCCPERNGLSRRASLVNTRLDRTRELMRNGVRPVEEAFELLCARTWRIGQ